MSVPYPLQSWTCLCHHQRHLPHRQRHLVPLCLDLAPLPPMELPPWVQPLLPKARRLWACERMLQTRRGCLPMVQHQWEHHHHQQLPVHVPTGRLQSWHPCVSPAVVCVRELGVPRACIAYLRCSHSGASAGPTSSSSSLLLCKTGCDSRVDGTVHRHLWLWRGRPGGGNDGPEQDVLGNRKLVHNLSEEHLQHASVHLLPARQVTHRAQNGGNLAKAPSLLHLVKGYKRTVIKLIIISVGGTSTAGERTDLMNFTACKYMYSVAKWSTRSPSWIQLGFKRLPDCDG